MRRETREPFERGFSLGVRAHHAHVHLCSTKIARDFNGGHGHESDDARILDALVEERGDFNPDRFGDSVGSASVVGHRVRMAVALQRSRPPLPQMKLVAVSTMRQNGLLSTNRSTAASTDSACRRSDETRQTVSSAVCHASCLPVSATETLNSLCKRSFKLFNTERLSLRECDPARWSSKDRTPMTIDT